MPRLRLIAAVSTVALAVSLVVPSSAQAATTLAWVDCPKKGDVEPPRDVRCATLKVPADWVTGRGEITLQLARKEATGEKIGTVIYLPGGPGDSASIS
ncbi:hypothetical protein LWC34_56505 [Kibdelosporangium philippinense]|uniref:Alpha/beta hydrolase n=1 Tax=Kibdelosporangium philippinense TaxID=211113 RepID=A0ABS8ZWQ1_9PSEU|nr:hypothetical protein [Kibdelosporangium philippinense]MCE7012155.1 hypothetical protein [Kibdelosporangium philippinense]